MLHGHPAPFHSSVLFQRIVFRTVTGHVGSVLKPDAWPDATFANCLGPSLNMYSNGFATRRGLYALARNRTRISRLEDERCQTRERPGERDAGERRQARDTRRRTSCTRQLMTHFRQSCIKLRRILERNGFKNHKNHDVTIKSKD